MAWIGCYGGHVRCPKPNIEVEFGIPQVHEPEYCKRCVYFGEMGMDGSIECVYLDRSNLWSSNRQWSKLAKNTSEYKDDEEYEYENVCAYCGNPLSIDSDSDLCRACEKKVASNVVRVKYAEDDSEDGIMDDLFVQISNIMRDINLSKVEKIRKLQEIGNVAEMLLRGEAIDMVRSEVGRNINKLRSGRYYQQNY